MLLAAKGKTDWEIAANLNISNQKAHPVAKAVSAAGSGGSGERCSPSRPETRYLQPGQRGIDP